MKRNVLTEHRARIASSATGSFLFVAMLWVLEAIDVVTAHTLDRLAALRSWDFGDVWGIFTMPWLHYGWAHLTGNSVILIVLAFFVGLTGRRVVIPLTLIVMVCSGVAAWLLSAPGTRTLGASGVVFGWLTYLLVRGVWSRSWKEILLGVVLAAAYGSVLWGVLPSDSGVSWQGHLGGAIGGLLAAWLISARDSRAARQPAWR